MAAYDDYDYPRYWSDRTYEHLSEVLVLREFFKKIGGGKNIIDVGGGYGRLAREYQKFAKKITMADPSGELLKKAKKYLSDIGNVDFVQSSVQDLWEKTGNKKFDVFVLVRVMHHIKNPKEAIEEAYRHLHGGGFLILEFANKLHGKAILKNILSGNLTFPLDIFPLDKRSKKNAKKDSIAFLNHHPDTIVESLKASGFTIIDKRSVSNIRNPQVKKYVPLSLLMGLEKLFQKPLAKINFGPSIFILAKKK